MENMSCALNSNQSSVTSLIDGINKVSSSVESNTAVVKELGNKIDRLNNVLEHFLNVFSHLQKIRIITFQVFPTPYDEQSSIWKSCLTKIRRKINYVVNEKKLLKGNSIPPPSDVND